MLKRKWYAILVSWLSLILIFSLSACPQPQGTTQESSQDAESTSQKPAEFEVGPIKFEPATVMAGDSVTVTATVKNIGDVAGIYTAIFTVDGQETDRKDITVDQGSSQETSFQLSKTTAGSYKLAIGDSNTTMTVYEWQPYKIQYDESNGVRNGIYVSGENGHIVHFTPPSKAFSIQKIKVFGTAKTLNTADLDKNNVTVRIWDKDGNNQLWSQDFPWRLFIADPCWREIKVPDVRVYDDFCVELVTHSTPMTYVGGTEIAKPASGDPIGLEELVKIILGGASATKGGGTTGGVSNIVVIGFEYPQAYINSPLNRPETRSAYSYMGKPTDTVEGEPIEGRLKGINWLIRVEGEGAPSN